ncbi:MAG: beta galactosidase jelly roll domain-containing protein [Tyzzerella sp.]|nr:beta galactosidase jelly roll domain-containing protein [Tyzzerella sp.]
MKCYIKDYPRPQFVRNQWENLNGTWDFGFDDQNVGETEKWYENFKGDLAIQVPFTFETKLSGIQDESRHDNIWYHKTIQVDAAKLEDHNYIIHFEGSDFVTKLWVNGQYAGSHRGGYSRFSFDITNLVKDGENELTVKVEDSFDLQQPRGKQRWMDEVYLCWYIPTTGIWKTVWTEYVPKISLSSVKMTPNISDFTLELEYNAIAPESRLNGDLLVEAAISYEGKLVSRTFTALTSNHVCAKVDVAMKSTMTYKNPGFLWTPSTPYLYDIEFRLLDGQTVLDEIGSYFAMREIRIDGSKVLLNEKPLYQRLILDQGYWKDSHLTPPSEEALIEDIDKIHALGYNGLRKHQKTEDERFLYWCDVKGMLVWCESPSTYQFSDYAVTEFITEWLEIVKQNYNHPSIITWTPVNESWGVTEIQTRRDQQHFTEAIYHLTKSIDKQRPVIVNDGWVHTISDIITLHDYVAEGAKLKERYTQYQDELLNNDIAFNNSRLAFADGYEYKGQPVIISEFGGIAFNNDDSGWGYGGKVNSKEDFLKRFDGVVTAVKELPYACGFCYTQVTDVQQEINGLMDIDRNFKIEPEIIKEINERKVSCLNK